MSGITSEDELANEFRMKNNRFSKRFGGVLSIHDLKFTKFEPKCYIFHMAKEGCSSGHWTCAISLPIYNTDYYMDSFGMPPPPEVIKFMKASGKKLIYNTSQVQDLDSDFCGWFCCYCLKEMMRCRRSFTDVIYNLDHFNTYLNDSLVKKISRHTQVID